MIIGSPAAGRTSIDAPHNEANGMGCEVCHGEDLLESIKVQYEEALSIEPENLDITFYNTLCLSCHLEPGAAPSAMVHSSRVTDSQLWTAGWSRQCIDCHNPHLQEQKFWLTDTSDAVPGDLLFLARGMITAFVYDPAKDQTVLTFDAITYKSSSNWDALSLASKTTEGRGAVIYPDISNLRMSYVVQEVDDALHTITVKGDAGLVWYYKDISLYPTDFGILYGQLIRKSVSIYGDPGDPATYLGDRPVRFFDHPGQNIAVDGSGICEVCHQKTRHFTFDGVGDDGIPDSPHTTTASNVGSGEKRRCTDCHFHTEGFDAPGNQSRDTDQGGRGR